MPAAPGPDGGPARLPAPLHGVGGLTQVRPLLLGAFPEQPLEQQAQVAEDDEGRRQGGALVVLHDEVVALELPERVRVALHHLEGVAVGPACGRRARAARLLRSGPAQPRAAPGGPAPISRGSLRCVRSARGVFAAPSALLDGADLPASLPPPRPSFAAPFLEALRARGPARPLWGAETPPQPQVCGAGPWAPPSPACRSTGIRPPEHGDQQVHEQHVGDQQEGDQQEDDQPVGVEVGAGGGALLQQGVQRAVHAGF